MGIDMEHKSKLRALLSSIFVFTIMAESSAGGSIEFLEPYSVEGLSVGAPVVRNSKIYKRYKCKPSDQYFDSTACRFSETKGGETKIITILHLDDNIVTYINKAVFPAIFTIEDINGELNRLSKRFDAAPQILKSKEGIIAKWGDIQLNPLNPRELTDLAEGRNPNLGYLIDFRMNFHDSARAGLPVFRLSGGKGFVWIARFQTNDREGTLRFLAADPSQMRHIGNQTPIGNDQSPSSRPSPPARNSSDPACQKYPDLC